MAASSSSLSPIDFAMMAFWIMEITTIVFHCYSFDYFRGGQMFRSTSCRPGSRRGANDCRCFYYELFVGRVFLERLKARDWQALAIQTVGCFSPASSSANDVAPRLGPLPSRRRVNLGLIVCTANNANWREWEARATRFSDLFSHFLICVIRVIGGL